MFLSPTQDAPRSAHIDTKHKAVLKNKKDARVVILKPQIPSSADTSNWRAELVLQPYFFVLGARSAEEPNMRHATVKADGIEIPILTNHRPIKQWEQIVASEDDVEQAKKKAKK